MSETLSASLPGALEARITAVLRALCDRGLTVSTAESCTGGLVASVLTDVDGCGHAFERGFVTYSGAAKIEDLDVPPDLIEARTAVSAEVAEAMARGALRRSGADIAVSVTGYAGPGGPDAEEGLVYLALIDRDGGLAASEFHFGSMGRGAVRLAALEAAVALLEDQLGRP
ncbi:CinA family protein [Brevundimonas sp. R86498]|uniref:CinA family protein n=1 Tax=Brevundimonas sp. R86498 TaxID=3093845 RepID=UPI0037CBD202